MSDLNTITADTILAVPLDAPERLFTGEAAAAKAEYRKLVKRWHPDHCKDLSAEAVFEHILALYKTAKRRLAAGGWINPHVTLFSTSDGKTFRLRHQVRRSFELGEVFVCRTHVAWRLDEAHRDLFGRAVRALDDLTFANAAMEKEMCRFLPQLVAAKETTEGPLFVLKKDPDWVPLSDVLAVQGGKLAGEHAGWILNGVYNIVCYLGYAGITHNAIGPETLFISPKNHAVGLFGGWWYAAKMNEPLTAAPGRTAGIMPSDVSRQKIADPRTDLEAIRLTGREILGDASGMRLAAEKAVPAAMASFLKQAASDSALTDYTAWKAVLKESYGESRFVILDVDAEDVFK